MKNLKKIAFASIILLFGFGVIAQKSAKHFDPETKLAKLAEALDLSENQIQELKPIFEKHHAQKQELKNAEGEREDKREAFHNLKETHKAELSKILTPEQVEKMEELHANRRHKRGHHRGMKGEKHEALRTEMQAYFTQNILPLAKSQRSLLDNKISSEDQEKIDELRSRLRKFKEGRHGKRGDHFKGEKGKCEGKDGEKCDGKSEEHKTKFKELKVLADKYETEIAEYLVPLKNNSETWKNDVRAIAQKHLGDKFDEERMNRKSHKIMKFLEGPGFLLLDPNSDFEMQSFDQKGKKGEVQRAVKTYPNPASSQSTLDYEVLESGMVKIDLYDRKGNLVKSILEEEKTAGQYSVKVDLSDLQKELYFYRITDAAGETSKRVMLK